MKDIYGASGKPEDIRAVLIERGKIKTRTFKRDIVDYSKWAGAGRKRNSDRPTGKSIYPDEMRFISYCYVVKEFKKDEDARKIYSSATEEIRENICSQKCKLKCFLN